jgi:hypothetical protein
MNQIVFVSLFFRFIKNRIPKYFKQKLIQQRQKHETNNFPKLGIIATKGISVYTSNKMKITFHSTDTLFQVVT